MTRGLSDADYRALAEFRRALRQFVAFSEEAARSAGLSPAQHQLMLAIRGAPGHGPPSLGDVAESLQLKLHSAGELVGRAEANGLVVRSSDPDDHRRVLLKLSPAGEEKLADLSRIHRDELRRFRTDLEALLGDLDDPAGRHRG
jgi:DNA-binding MarR family transcriptional regulator